VNFCLIQTGPADVVSLHVQEVGMLSLSKRVTPLCIAMLCLTPLWAQQPAQGQRRPGGGPSLPDPLVLDDQSGFQPIFDGTMKGWDGDPDFWRAEGGALIGESTKEKPLARNTFLVWRQAQPADFELKLQYRINSTNSGVQYRSVELPEAGKWVLKGYQADIDAQNRYTGQLYEERGRGFLAMRGQSTYIEEGKKARVIANLMNSEELKASIKIDDWNQLHIIARGNVLIHILNGQLMSVAIDDDSKNRAMAGLLGFQLHAGPPMKVEFRNIWLKTK
jgi:hypothetical protein